MAPEAPGDVTLLCEALMATFLNPDWNFFVPSAGPSGAEVE